MSQCNIWHLTYKKTPVIPRLTSSSSASHWEGQTRFLNIRVSLICPKGYDGLSGREIYHESGLNLWKKCLHFLKSGIQKIQNHMN